MSTDLRPAGARVRVELKAVAAPKPHVRSAARAMSFPATLAAVAIRRAQP